MNSHDDSSRKEKDESQLSDSVDLTDIGIEMSADTESKELHEAEKKGAALEDALDELVKDVKLGIAEARSFSSLEFPKIIELNEISKRNQFAKLVDEYLQLQDHIPYGRFAYSVVSKRIQELKELVNSIGFNDDVHQDTKKEVLSFIKFIDAQFDKVKAVPTTPDEKNYHPLALKLDQTVTEFLNDLKKTAKELGTAKPLFGYSTKWKDKINELKIKYQTKPYKLLDLLDSINDDYKNIPAKIKSNIQDIVDRLNTATNAFKSDYIDKNKALDPATQTTANGFFGVILQYHSKTFGKKLERKIP